MQTRPSPKILVPLLRADPDFSALQDPEAWRAVQEAAAWHRMSAMVAVAVRPHASVEQRRWCDETLTDSWRRHDRNIVHLDRVLGLLADAGVEVLALKGPILGLRHFRPPFLRRISVDIDLAVRDVDLDRAVATLATQGYTPTMDIDDARRTSHHLELACPGQPNVELHTRISKMSLGMPVEDLFVRAVEHPLPTGRVARIPCPTDELLGLFVHLAGDRFASFFHLCEVLQIWRAASPDVQAEVLASAVRYRVSAAVWMAHIAFGAYWGESLLDTVADIPRPWLHRLLDEEFLRRVEANVTGDGLRGLSARLQGRWLDLHMTESAGEMLRMATLILKVALRETAARRWGPIARPSGIRPRSVEGKRG